MKKFIMVISLSLTLAMSLSGCNIVKKSDTHIGTALNQYRLSDMGDANGFFVSNGEVFADLYYRNINVSSTTTQASSSRVLFVENVEENVPVIEAGLTDHPQSVVYFSNANVPTTFVLERFQNYGYSVGMSGIVEDPETSRYYWNPNEAASFSSIEEIASNLKTSLLLDSINNQKLTDEMFSRGGTINGLEKNKKYTLGVYMGTKYGTFSVIADACIMISYEIYEIDDYSYTTDGYIMINLPDDLPSGYYMIEGAGLFYYNNPNVPETYMTDEEYTSQEQTSYGNSIYDYEYDGVIGGVSYDDEEIWNNNVEEDMEEATEETTGNTTSDDTEEKTTDTTSEEPSEE